MPKIKTKASKILNGVGNAISKYRMWLYAIIALLLVVGAIILVINFANAEFYILGALIIILAAFGWFIKKPKERLTTLKGWGLKIVTLLGTLVKLSLAALAGLAFFGTVKVMLPHLSAALIALVAIGFAVATFQIVDFSKGTTWKSRGQGLLIAFAFVAGAHLLNDPSLVDRFKPTEQPTFVHYQHQAEVDANRAGIESYTEVVKLENQCHEVKDSPSVKTDLRDGKCFVSIRVNDGSARIYVGKNTHAVNHTTSGDGMWTIIEIDKPNQVDITIFRFVFKPGPSTAQPIPAEFLKQKLWLYVHPTYVRG